MHKFEETRFRNQALAERLLRSSTPAGAVPDIAPAAEIAPPPPPPQDADAIVAHIEINDHHGVGVLLGRLFGQDENIISIRSKNFYEGCQHFGAMHACIAHPDASRDMVIWNTLQGLNSATIRRVLCVPYFPDDVRNALALKQAFGVPLATFLMDDQNLYADGIPDTIMEELLAKSSLRLAISPDMSVEYEKKYGYPIWFMPPLAPTGLIPQRLNRLSPEVLRKKEALILGNIWGQRWLQLLRSIVRDSGITLRWYNNGEFRWLPCSKDDLVLDGILPQEGPPDPDDTFVEKLRQAAFVVVPSGTLDDSDDRRFIAQLSFPSRIPYILATSHTPMLVVGNPQTAAARIVNHLGIGMSVPYERPAFIEAVDRITQPAMNLALRRNAFLLSVRFADLGASEWIWQSLAKGQPVDNRYEDLMPRHEIAASPGSHV